MRISNKGVEFIKRREGTVRDESGMHRPYEDSAGHATIGYGHLLHPGPPIPQDRSISDALAEQLLREDLGNAERAVKIAVKPPLTQPQYDAMVSFFFNLGLGKTFNSNLVQLLNAPIFWEALAEGCRWPGHAVREELLRWNKAGGKTSTGLTNRRMMEANLFLEGDYSLE